MAAAIHDTTNLKKSGRTFGVVCPSSATETIWPRLCWRNADHAGPSDEGVRMGKKRKATKRQIQAAERAKTKLAQKQARDDAYRAALGLAKGAKLPGSLGNTASAGGGRDRRGRATGGIGESTRKNGMPRRGRARLIG